MDRVLGSVTQLHVCHRTPTAWDGAHNINHWLPGLLGVALHNKQNNVFIDACVHLLTPRIIITINRRVEEDLTCFIIILLLRKDQQQQNTT